MDLDIILHKTIS